jgi:hypothetical protein
MAFLREGWCSFPGERGSVKMQRFGKVCQEFAAIDKIPDERFCLNGVKKRSALDQLCRRKGSFDRGYDLDHVVVGLGRDWGEGVDGKHFKVGEQSVVRAKRLFSDDGKVVGMVGAPELCCCPLSNGGTLGDAGLVSTSDKARVLVLPDHAKVWYILSNPVLNLIGEGKRGGFVGQDRGVVF